jgi:nucleotide-binding universal stress UspA family protein
MDIDHGSKFTSAINDFRSARNRAVLKEIIARFTGETTELLSYDEVREKIKAQASAEKGLQDIPLEAIVGSVNRYNDFTRDFLPRHDEDKDRWARVELMATGLTGFPPIEVYKIGETYFVKDGNHRVSVARQLGAKFIHAYVTEVRTRVPMTPDVKPDDLIIKAEYSDFLEKTRLDGLRPNADFSVTAPGKYPLLEEHIAVHRYFMGIEQQHEIPYGEAVTHWYDMVYLPVVEIIREKGVLRYFPGRTETDLYLWISEHRAALEDRLGWDIKTEYAVSDLLGQYAKPLSSSIVELGEKILDTVSFGQLESGPPPGHWRREALEPSQRERLFEDILVPIDGGEGGWRAFDQSMIIAEKERSSLHGLHVVKSPSEVDSDFSRAIQSEFNIRCADAGIAGNMSINYGDINQEICSLSRWTDLVTTSLTYPPPSQALAKIGSGFRKLIQRCPRPILAVPEAATPLKKALLAYDGSLKSHEALFVATYLAGVWNIPVVVVTVFEDQRIAPETLLQAKVYLDDHNVRATYISEEGPAAYKILDAAESNDCDLLIMGGYGYNPVFNVVLGSTVDTVLRECDKPMMICR